VATKNKAPNIRILTIRDQKVVLDSDLAAVYGVTTKRLNEQLRRNRKRFPEDFAFRLTADEFESLRSQFATLDDRGGGGVNPMRSQNATGSKRMLGENSGNWSQLRPVQESTAARRIARGHLRNTERCKRPTFCEAIARLR
jgi:hypothetical protein